MEGTAKTYRIELTEEEFGTLINALDIAALWYGERADRLAEHNSTGVNTKAIEYRRDASQKCDDLWCRLYEYKYKANRK